MLTKKCSYKGCGTYSNSTHQATEIFYSFPKHPERLKIWMELGGCLNEKELPCVARYFCSKHFDETKYVAKNPRRKQLLSTAIPYPFSESNQQQNEMNIIDETEYQCVVSSVDPIVDEYDANEVNNLHIDEHSEEVTNEISCISESVETLESFEEDYQNEDSAPIDFEEALEAESRPLKRKLDHSIIKQSQVLQRGPSKRSVTIVSNRPTSTINVFEHQKMEERDTDEESDLLIATTEPANATTFIFKGEEYIQMPKAEYNREKVAFLNKIRNYEEVLKSVKHLMDNVKI